MLEKINVTKGIHKPKTGINDCKWQVIVVPLNKSPAVSSRSQYTVCRYLLHGNTMQLFCQGGLMAEGFCAPKTNSFSLLASLLSGLPLSSPSHSHLFTHLHGAPASVVVQAVRQQGIKALPQVVRMWKSLTSDSLLCFFFFSFSFPTDGLSVLMKASSFPLTMTSSTWIRDYLPRSRLQSACL